MELADMSGKVYEENNPGIFVKWEQVLVCVRNSDMPVQGHQGGSLAIGNIAEEEQARGIAGQVYFWAEGDATQVGCINMIYATFEAIAGSRGFR